MSEAQWLKAVEEGEDLQIVIQRNIDRREKRVADGGPEFSEEDDEEEEDEEDDGRNQEEFVMSTKHGNDFKAPRNRAPKQQHHQEPVAQEV